MTTFTPPALRQFLWAWKKHPEHLEESSEAARAWLSDAQAGLARLKPLILWREDNEEWLRQADLDLQEIERLLGDKPPTEVSPEKAQSLQEVLDRYFSHLFKLQKEEEQVPGFSPILALDQTIRVAFNLHQGRCDAVDLQVMFPYAHSAVLQARAELELRRRLFPEQDWPLDEFLYQMEGGIGALSQFLESGERRVLEESIQLLGAGSSEFTRKLEEIRLRAAEDPQFSSHDLLECWLRLQAYPYDMTEAVGHLWNRLYGRLDEFWRAVQMARQAGLGIADPDKLERSGELHRTVVEALQQISSQTLEPAQQAQLLVRPWNAMVDYQEKLHPEVRKLQESIQGAPGMIDLLQLLAQAEAEILPLWVLQEELSQRLELQQKSHAALEEVPELAGGTASNLLGSHTMAYRRMLLYCEDRDRQHLIESWKLLALTLPPLLQFEAEMRQRTSPGGKSGQQVTCVRCGAVQRPARVCSSCGSALPQLAIDDVRYQDISGQEVHDDAGAVSDQLVNLIHGVQFGSATWEQVREELTAQIEAAGKIRERFEREMLKMMGRDTTLDAYCQFFVVKLGQLSQTLISLAESAQQGHVVALQAGLGAYREVHEELQEFQKKIGEGMGGSTR